MLGIPTDRELLEGYRRPWVMGWARWFALPFALSGPLVWATANVADVVARGFAERPPTPSPRLFSQLPEAETGIVTSNRYDDPRMWNERYHEFDVGPIGTGVAIGDYDNDGKPDLFIVSKVESGRLFRNLGGWKFEDVTERAGVADNSGEWKQGATFVDVNNDGLLDLYVCRFNAPNLLFMNQGKGAFREEAQSRGLAVIDACGMAAFADYDRDGWLDVYIQTNLLDSSAHPNGQRDYLFHNDGNGRFTNVSDRAGVLGETQGHAATWWDFDEDGWPDLYVTNDFGVPDFLYHNNRDGTFTNVAGSVLPHTPLTSMAADFGDVNNDGHIDFLATDMATTTHEKDQRGMADTRSLTKEITAPDPLGAPQFPHNALFVATGTGKFLELAYLAGIAATDWTWSVRWEDLDNDGRLDLHVTNGMNREQTNTDLIRGMMVAESPRERVRLMKSSPVLAETNLAYRNSGDMGFEPVGPAWGLDEKGVSFGAAFGDLDGDGDLDLVYTNYQKGATVLRNDGVRGNSVEFALRGTQSNRYGVGASLRIETKSGVQTRVLALARGYLSSSEPILHFGLGGDDRVDRLVVQWPSGCEQVLSDLGVNQLYTITEPATVSPPPAAPTVARPLFIDASAQLGNDLSSREEFLEGTVTQPLLPRMFNRSGPALAVAILRPGDSDDVVIGGTSRDPLRVVENSAGQFSVPPVAGILPSSINDGPILAFDVSGDGANDLLVTGGGAALPAEEPEYQPRLYINGGQGRWSPASRQALPAFPVSVGSAVAADFDRDGRLDLFLGGRVSPGYFPEPPQSGLWRNEGGRFVDVTATLAPELARIGMVTSALWSDVDGDGWTDLLVTLDWGGVKVFRNEQGRRLADRSAEWGFKCAGTGWWTAIAAADFNHDGRPDFVVGNVGTNTPFRASPDNPEVLLAGNFAGTGEIQLIEAYYEGSRLVPHRSRRELGAKIPVVLRRFPKNDRYAAAALEEILPPEQIAAATRLSVTELRSGLLLSQRDGTWRFAPLPTLAQASPIQGLVAADFDGDGNADVCAVQNSYAPSPVYGRFDGGLGVFLRGDGTGNFATAAPADSGVIVSGDAKSLVVIDANGDGAPDLLASRNNSTPVLLINQASSARHLVVRLKGRAGNPSGIGAVITAEMAGRATQTAEVYAGGGFASQSSSAVFFGVSAGEEKVKLTVRWPLGSSSEMEVRTSQSLVVVAE